MSRTDVINYDPDRVGAAGIVGRGNDGVYYFGGVRYGQPANVIDVPKPVECLDSCMIIVDKLQGYLFDDTTFNGLHCFVEDFCCHQRFIGKSVIVLPLRIVEHFGTTTRKLVTCWGNYNDARDQLVAKWRDKVSVITT